MAWAFNRQPTGEYKYESPTQSPNGEMLTLKGVRVIHIKDLTGISELDDNDDAQTFSLGLSKFFDIFGLTIPPVSSTGPVKGVRTCRDNLTFTSS